MCVHVYSVLYVCIGSYTCDIYPVPQRITNLLPAEHDFLFFSLRFFKCANIPTFDLLLGWVIVHSSKNYTSAAETTICHQSSRPLVEA